MFEYTTIHGDKVTLNPNNITVILECDVHCNVYTSDSGDPIKLEESYDKVKNDFNKFMYSIKTVYTI